MRIEDWLGKDNKIGIDIWNKKYRNENESFEDWLDRISGGPNNEGLKQLIREKKFLFGGRILANRGLQKEGRKITYSNCYVITPPEDNLESIFDCAKKLARTFSYGGGCGIDISKLAPKGAIINNAAKETSGAVSFMQLYNMTTDLIGQNGRRGALMLSISSEHPDLEEFIDIKNNLDNINKANISIRMSDEFMQQALNCKEYELSYFRKETEEIIKKDVDAAYIFNKICENNWRTGEPGLLFWDRIKNWNLICNNLDFNYAGVNPCAEEPLPAGGSCLLGSLNLAEFVDEEQGVFKQAEFRDAVQIAVIALNEVLEEGLLLHPLQEQQKSVNDWRQIGLGIMGLADMFIKLGITYGSEESINLCHAIGLTMADAAIARSARLAKEKGKYPKYQENQLEHCEFFYENTYVDTRSLVSMYGLRNSQLLTIAPTGSISTMLGVSGGIEPIFDTHYTRKTESLHGEDKTYIVYTPIVKRYMDENNVSIDELPEYFVTAKDIDPIDRINVQAAWQKHIDASISSTINLPENTTVGDIMKYYAYAWNEGCKGLTIFRDNCERAGILNSINKEQSVKNIDRPAKFDFVKPITRNELGSRLSGTTYCKNNACGKMYITINRDDDDNLVEVFIDSSKSGGCSANAEALGRFASACMRGGMSIESIVDITKGVKCAACIQVKGSKSKKIDGISCGDILAKTILEEYERYHKKQDFSEKHKESKIINFDDESFEYIDLAQGVIYKRVCPDCGEELIFEGGCAVCKNCGYSKCD